MGLLNIFNSFSEFFILIFIVILWGSVWRLIAMWKAVKKDSVAWFIVLGVFSTIGVLPILYIYIFSKIKTNKKSKKEK